MNYTRHLCSLLLLLASSAAGHAASAAAQIVSDLPELAFQSAFESTCAIVPLGTSGHDIIGKDTTLSYTNDWVEDLEKQAGLKALEIDLDEVLLATVCHISLAAAAPTRRVWHSQTHPML
jgi:hypothetical protein